MFYFFLIASLRENPKNAKNNVSSKLNTSSDIYPCEYPTTVRIIKTTTI